jgi:hypothetical protein
MPVLDERRTTPRWDRERDSSIRLERRLESAVELARWLVFALRRAEERTEDHLAELIERRRSMRARATLEARVADAHAAYAAGAIDDEALGDLVRRVEYAADREARGARPLTYHTGHRLTQ